MPIFLFDAFGSASIGVYTLATDNLLIVPNQISRSDAKKLGEWLGVKVIQTNIGGSVLIGSLVCANSNGMILPHFVRDEELEIIKSSSDINITIMDTKKTAYGNLVLANDRGAIVDPRLRRREMRKIEDTLGVEVVAGEIAGLPYVGSLALATNKGVLAHPLLTEDEEKILREVLKVHVGVGTINCGIPYIATGVIGNSRAVVAGYLTTGPEMVMIGQALGVVE